MTERPYTDTDLRAEAARQHAAASWDPDLMGVAEQMECAPVAHTDDGHTALSWQHLLVPEGGGSWETFEKAQQQIHGLIDGAADVSDWAVDLGADGLEPDEEHVDIAGARIHFAFHADMPEEMRASVIAAVHAATTEGAQR